MSDVSAVRPFRLLRERAENSSSTVRTFSHLVTPTVPVTPEEERDLTSYPWGVYYEVQDTRRGYITGRDTWRPNRPRKSRRGSSESGGRSRGSSGWSRRAATAWTSSPRS